MATPDKNGLTLGMIYEDSAKLYRMKFTGYARHEMTRENMILAEDADPISSGGYLRAFPMVLWMMKGFAPYVAPKAVVKIAPHKGKTVASPKGMVTKQLALAAPKTKKPSPRKGKARA